MAIENEEFGSVVFRYVKVGEPDGVFVVVDELPAPDTDLCARKNADEMLSWESRAVLRSSRQTKGAGCSA